MPTESVILTIKNLPGAFGPNPPCVIDTPIGKRITDSLESAIPLAQVIGAGICRSRFPSDDQANLVITCDVRGLPEPTSISGSSIITVEVVTTAALQSTTTIS